MRKKLVAHAVTALFAISLCVGPLLALSCAVSGCASQSRAAYNTVAAPVLSAENVMSAWGDYVAKFHPGPVAERKVLNAYLKVKVAELAAIDLAHVAASATNFAGALSDGGVGQALADLVALVQAYGVKL